MGDDTGQSNTTSGDTSASSFSDTPLANSSTWPDSTKMANENPADSSNLANQSAPTSDSGQVPPAETPSDSAAANRPDSIDSADSSQIPADSTILANPPVSADLSAEAQAKEDSTVESPADSSPPPISVPTDSPSQPQTGSPSSDATSSPASPQSPLSPSSPTTPSDSATLTASEIPLPISINPPDNQAPQAQSDTPESTSSIVTSSESPNLANIKPEPPEQSQEAPLANDKSDGNTSRKSFGDILASENQAPPIPSTPSTPPVPSSSSPISFGDLIKDIKPEDSVIQPPATPPTPSPISSTAPQPPTQNPQPISSSPQSPTPPSSHSLNRIKANAKRLEKKQKHLDQILSLAKESANITNTDVQRLCRVSQSTATNYLSELAKKGLLKKQGIRGGAKYTL